MIVALTQYFLQYHVLQPMLLQAGSSPALDNFHFFLLVLDTVLIAAGGYLINDIIDYRMDLVNKPGKVFINSLLSRRTALLLYIIINLAGLVIAWYLAVHVKNRALFAIYPVAAGLLYFYSSHVKKWPLAGNLVVALFCAFVAGVVLFAERETYFQLSGRQPVLAEKISLLFGGYLLFAFLSTLLREVVKDMEDIEGDRQLGLQTLPIMSGIRVAKNWASAFNWLLILSISLFLYWLFENENWFAFVFAFTGLILPLVYIAMQLSNAVEKSDFSRLSQLIKYIMLAGLFLLILC
jgi:4-hydroxybenzoate polyprenyltransferase